MYMHCYIFMAVDCKHILQVVCVDGGNILFSITGKLTVCGDIKNVLFSVVPG